MRFPCVFRTNVVLALLWVGVGCFSPVNRPAERSAIDQQVTSAAVRACVAELDLSGIEQSRSYFLKVSAPSGTDFEWVRAALAERLLAKGFQVVRDPERSQGTLEATVAFAGTDLAMMLIGIPLFVPGSPVAFGDISVYKSTTMTGRVQLGLQVWDESGRLAYAVPDARASRFFKNLWFPTVIGPFLRTDLEDFREPGKESAE